MSQEIRDAANAAATALEESLASEATVVDGVIAFIDANKAQVEDAIASSSTLQDLTTRLQAGLAANEAHKQRLAESIATVPPPEG